MKISRKTLEKYEEESLEPPPAIKFDEKRSKYSK